MSRALSMVGARRVLVAGALFTLALATAGRALAVPGAGALFATDAGGHYFAVDPTTGDGTTLGSLGGAFVLAVHPRSGKTYGGVGTELPSLFTVDFETGNVDFVGQTRLGPGRFGGMDFHWDGTLYATVDRAGEEGNGADHLVTINPRNGRATVVGPFGTCVGDGDARDRLDSCTLEGIDAIAFDRAGTLWGLRSGTAELYVIDPSTGAATLVVPLVDGTGQPAAEVSSLHFGCDGTLYAGQGGRLVRIDSSTGVVTPIGTGTMTGGFALRSLAFRRVCMDRFLCHIASPSHSAPRFEPVSGVELVDDYGAAVARLSRVDHVCNPEQKDGAGLMDPAIHMTSFDFRQSPPHERQFNLEVTTEFGTFTVDETLFPQLLFVPSSLALGAVPPPPDPAAHTLDHFKCYRLNYDHFPNRYIPTQDEFTTPSRVVKLRKPRLLCNPADENGGGVKGPLEHMVCYRFATKQNQPKDIPITNVRVNNEFHPPAQDAGKDDLLCVPASVVPGKTR